MNRLAEKFIDIYRRSTFIRYCVVGGISWVTDAVTLIAVNRLTPQLLTDDVTRLAVATYAGGIVGFVVNYILTLIMAFNSGEDKRTGKKFSAFLIILAVSIVGWVMKEWLMNLGVNILLSRRRMACKHSGLCDSARMELSGQKAVCFPHRQTRY